MRILMTGASGELGAYCASELARREHDLDLWSGRTVGAVARLRCRPVDLGEREVVLAALDESRPDLILHLGAISAAREVQLAPETAHRINVEGTRTLAEWCRANGRRILFTSTDLVFDGTSPWRSESDPAEPILEYGRTKRRAEEPVLSTERGQVARLSLLYGPSLAGRPSYFEKTIEGLRQGIPQTFFEDEYRTPLDLATAARALVLLVEGDATGIVHVGGAERMSRLDLMRRAAKALGLDPSLVRGNRRSEVELAEPRPEDVSLRTDRLRSLLPDLKLPTVEEALA